MTFVKVTVPLPTDQRPANRRPAHTLRQVSVLTHETIRPTLDIVQQQDPEERRTQAGL